VARAGEVRRGQATDRERMSSMQAGTGVGKRGSRDREKPVNERASLSLCTPSVFHLPCPSEPPSSLWTSLLFFLCFG
jgi:hypothetical protein